MATTTPVRRLSGPRPGGVPDTTPPAPPPPPPGDSGGGGGGGGPVGLGPLGWARWAWRQLTSMRTALLLLLLLAVGAVPGSVFPQTSIDPVRVTQYEADHPSLAPWLSRLGAFDVYSSPWFSAIYLLLFVSLVGCVLPRARVHLRNLREAPPRTPARLSRLPEHRASAVDAEPREVLDAARAVLRARRYRVADHPGSVAAQRGELRESGNLLFHLSLVGVIVSFAVSSLWGYREQEIVVQGQAFADSVAAYDTFDPGGLVDTDDLPPFRFVLRSLHVRFDDSSAGNQFGAPRSFQADVDVVDHPGAAERRDVIRVNHPLRVSGASVYLAGNGYAPVITVRDSTGRIALREAVPFLVKDANYTSDGVVKVTDSLPQQLGLQAVLLPTATATPNGLVSTFPDERNPKLLFTAYAGDLGLDGGVPQNVYQLDPSHMRQLTTATGAPFSAALSPGQSVALPGGNGTVTFDRLDRYAGLTVRHDPARAEALLFSVLALVGLTVSLFVPRRRVWVRALAAPATGDGDGVGVGDRDGDGDGDAAGSPGGGGRTLVEVGALARSEDPGLRAEADAVLAAITAALAGGPEAGAGTGAGASARARSGAGGRGPHAADAAGAGRRP